MYCLLSGKKCALRSFLSNDWTSIKAPFSLVRKKKIRKFKCLVFYPVDIDSKH